MKSTPKETAPAASTAFCPHCGDRLPKLKQTAVACPICGGDLKPEKARNTARTAGLLSLVLPGAGQVFNGQFFRGLLIFATSWLIVPWLFGVIDAYGTARRAELAQGGVLTA